MKFIIFFFLIFVKVSPSPDPEIIDVEVIRVFHHDSKAFTQGLTWHDGYLYETTGLYGESSLRKVNLDTGDIAKGISLQRQYFGEGSTIYNSKIYMLTWREKTGFVYNMDFSLLQTFSINTDGWGLTHNTTHLIYSDGSQKLFFLNPETFRVERTLKVQSWKDGKKHDVSRLNELEYIDGYVYANIYGLEKIAIIDIGSGLVVKWFDCTKLRGRTGARHGSDVFNGIAYDEEKKRLFLTGKLWSNIYEVKPVDVVQLKTELSATTSKSEL